MPAEGGEEDQPIRSGRGVGEVGLRLPLVAPAREVRARRQYDVAAGLAVRLDAARVEAGAEVARTVADALALPAEQELASAPARALRQGGREPAEAGHHGGERRLAGRRHLARGWVHPVHVYVESPHAGRRPHGDCDAGARVALEPGGDGARVEGGGVEAALVEGFLFGPTGNTGKPAEA